MGGLHMIGYVEYRGKFFGTRDRSGTGDFQKEQV